MPQDLEEIEEWNEYGELKQQIASTDVAAPTQKVSATNTPSKLPTAHGSVVAAAPKASPDLPSTSPLSKGMGEESDALRMTPSRKEETPLTMAMRQAGAEAAKKADEKKGSRLTAPISGKGLKAIEVSTPAVATKMPKSVEEPGSSTETEVPGNLTEEGTKRNSMDQIVGADGSSEQEHIGSFEEATMPEARRAGNTAKTQSPFSGTATTSSREHEATSLESSPRAPRGSSVSMGTKENIEKENAISEETEDAGPRSIKTSTQDTEEPPTSRPGTAEKPEDSADATTSDVTATDEGEAAATKGNKPQGQNAKDPEAASASVGD